MKKITHYYGADLSWVENLAEKYEGYVEGNFVRVPEHIHTGVRYFLDCGDGIIAWYVDVNYKQDLHLIQINKVNDFIGLYYNLTKGHAVVNIGEVSEEVGKLDYNLLVIDSTLQPEYYVKEGSSTYALCIFIKKTHIERYLKKNNVLLKRIQKLMDPKENTFIKFDRMTDESFHILTDLRKHEVGGLSFNLNLSGAVNLLISEFLRKMTNEKVTIQTVNKANLDGIIKSQSWMIDNIEKSFPSIKKIAAQANMSESKFKILFYKVTGETPNVFFMRNKLIRSKELLEERRLTISEISDKLNFSNHSYFTIKFKEKFGMSPKRFLTKL
ncbi:AraC family transcriptional regulator [Flavobacterium bizetiae]|uniref:helix-turn-helix domain-containing protein n=1 Tax=Flavobacterium bizetiae TaxID=2704140 RepID=UPI0021E86600|nr:AraC family transcriptional regulator [Flavobacterium bizetiae]UTN04864.1 AraC family transcriptional regulator [Flavobacterium bizetiae]